MPPLRCSGESTKNIPPNDQQGEAAEALPRGGVQHEHPLAVIEQLERGDHPARPPPMTTTSASYLLFSAIWTREHNRPQRQRQWPYRDWFRKLAAGVGVGRAAGGFADMPTSKATGIAVIASRVGDHHAVPWVRSAQCGQLIVETAAVDRVRSQPPTLPL